MQAVTWDSSGFLDDPICYYQTSEGDLLFWYGSIRVLDHGRQSKLVAWRPE